MNYISLLTNEELTYICKMITGKNLKMLFKSYSKEFAQIKRGFRATSLSENEAISLAVKHKDKPFISTVINKQIEEWLKETDEYLKKQELTFRDHDKAVAKMLLGSVFCDDIVIYYKVKDIDVNDLYLEKMRALMAEVKQEIQEENKATFEEGLSQRYSTIQDEELKVAYQEKLKALEEEKEYLTKQISEVTERVEILEKLNEEYKEELIDLRARVKYEDRIEYGQIEKISEKTYDNISFCEVSEPDYSGQKYLIRLADINRSGVLETFHFNEDLPRYFANRTKLFFKDGPTETGIMGVWNWTSIPNKMDHTKDYVDSCFNPHICPIQVIILDMENEGKLLDALKNGVNADIDSKRVFFAISPEKSKIVGILCDKGDLLFNSDMWKLRDNVLSVPKYEFSKRDIIGLQNQKYFLRKIDAGIPVAILNIKNPFEVVKHIISSRYSWQLFKQMGKTRNDWKMFRDFFKGLEVDSIVSEIASSIRCSEEKAAKILNDFIKNVESYIDGTTIEDQILASLVSVDKELQNRCMSLLTTKWEKEHQERVTEAQAEIEKLEENINKAESKFEKQRIKNESALNKQISDAEQRMYEIKKTYDELRDKLTVLTDEIAKKEKLAADVECIVSERIKKAQENAAEFIAGMAFVNRDMYTGKMQSEPVAMPNIVVEASTSNNFGLYHLGKEILQENVEKVFDWNDTIDVISYGLTDAGVIAGYTKPLAAYLLSAYLNRSPVFLIGPNANEIADALSAALYGKKADVLELGDTYSPDAIKTFYEDQDGVVRISNPFSPAWISKIPDIVCRTNKYCFVVYPYSEDIQIEPKSMFTYILPLFTELFVNKTPSTNRRMGGLRAENYKDFTLRKSEKIHEKVLTSMKVPALVKTKIQKILTNMHKMLEDKNVDYDIMFAILPYAFATMQMQKLIDMLNDTEKYKIQISADAVRLLEIYIGEEE